MQHCTRGREFRPIVRRFRAIVLGLALSFLQSMPLAPVRAAGAAPICDPPGPPPRFACQWSLDVCDWICPVCDPFGVAPRSACTWDGSLCNWICPGYTGVEVTVRTIVPPLHDATLYVRLSSLCTATGASGTCGGSVAVSHRMSASEKCQAIAGVVASDCAATGYAVTVDDCRLEASFTAANVGCPATPFALGLSNDSSVFDEAGLGPLPDGESDETTGVMPDCAPRPGPAGNLRLAPIDGGASVQLTWDDATDADDYVILSDASPNGSFDAVAGIASSGNPGLTLGLQPGIVYYLVAGRNAACGLGPRR